MKNNMTRKKDRWHTQRLCDVCNVEYGTRVVNKRDGGTIFSVYGGGGATFFMDDYNREDRMVIARFAMSNACTRFVKGRFFLNDSGLTISPQNKKEIAQEFLDYQVLNLNDVIYSLAKGSAQKNLDVPTFRNLEIRYPDSLAEQLRIVSVLDSVFSNISIAKENTEKNLRNSRELFESYLHKVLTSSEWEVKELGEVCERVEYGTSSKSKKEGRVPVLRMGNIQNGRFDWDKLVYSSDKAEIKKYLLKHNDVLFNRTNSPELVGKTAIYKDEMPAIFAGYLIRIHRKEKLLDADYLNYFLNSNMARDYGKTMIVSSVNQANINGQKLKSYPIPVPPLSDQHAIVSTLDSLSTQTKKLESLYKQKLANLEELKKSILKKAFSGEL